MILVSTLSAQVYPPAKSPAELETQVPDNRDNPVGLMQIHLAWGWGKESSWTGSATLSEGFLAGPVPLGNTADIPGSFYVESGELRFKQSEPSRFNGFQATVYAPLTASIRIRLSNPTTDESYEKTVPLKEIVQQTFAQSIDSQGNRLILRRVHGDELAVVPKHSSLVFGPDEIVYLDLYPRFLSVEFDPAQFVELGLFRARTEEKIPYSDQAVPISAERREDQMSISVRLPHEPGVYDLVLALKQPKSGDTKGIANIFSRDKDSEVLKLAERTVQIVVVDSVNHWAASLRETGNLSTLKTEQEFLLDPADPLWWKPLAKSSSAFAELLHQSGAVESRSVDAQPEKPAKESSSLFKPRWSGIRGLSSKILPIGSKHNSSSTEEKESKKIAFQGDPLRLFTPSPRFGDTPSRSEIAGPAQPLQSLWTHGRISTRSTAFGPFTTLQNVPGNDGAAWAMYPIPIRNVNEPHILEVEYLANDSQSLGISILEQSKNGGLDPISLDSGVDRAEEVAGETAQERILTHRIVFWPKTELPLVLLSNQQEQRTASFGRIRLYRATGPFPRAFTDQSERLFAAYLHRPAIAENFGATRGIGDYFLSGATDWVTFFEGCNRFSDYLQSVGYNGAMISVSADGSTIYPSETAAPTPKYDSGVFLLEGEDPIRKDVVELVARIFDREKLTLIPAVDFNAPIPRLEERIRRELQSRSENGVANGSPAQFAGKSGYYWIDPTGKTLVQVRGTKSGRAPYYNMLHPVVQEEMLNHILELLVRYGNHSSFGGIAVQLSADGFAQLPEEFWGMDDYTIAQFQEETQTPIPSSAAENRFTQRYEYIRTHCLENWIRWRAKKVAAFYRKMNQMIVHFRPDAKLYLAGATMLDGERVQSTFYPTFVRRNDAAQTLLILGFDLNEFQNERSLVFMRPWKTSFSGQPTTIAAQLEMEQAELFAPLYRNGSASTPLFYNRNNVLSLPSFERKCPYQPSDTRFVFQAAPSAQQNRKRFVRELAKSDVRTCFDGGQFLSLGQEDALTDWIAVFRRLPAVPFQTYTPPRPQENAMQTPRKTAGSQTTTYGNIQLAATTDSTQSLRPAPLPVPRPQTSIQPLVVRYARAGEEMIVYLVNEAAFHVEARITFNTNSATELAELTGRRKIPAPIPTDDRLTWNVVLEPYDLLAVRLSDPVGIPLDVVVKCPEEICGPKGKLSRVFDTLIRATDNPVSWDGLENRDFEANTDDPTAIPGWTRVGDDTFTVKLDFERKHSGRAGMQMVGLGTSGGVLSRSFDAPRTGRLFVNLWIGLEEKTRQCPLRLALTGRDRNSPTPFLRTASLEQVVLSTAGGVAPVDGVRWCLITVPFTRLPFDSLDNLAIRLDLTAEGTVWVDDVRLDSVAFTDTERIELLKMISVASYLPSNNRVSESVDLLEGFWSQLLLENRADLSGDPTGLFASRGRKAEPRPAYTEKRTPPKEEAVKITPPKPESSPSFFNRLKFW